jgi:hypothetical protein
MRRSIPAATAVLLLACGSGGGDDGGPLATALTVTSASLGAPVTATEATQLAGTGGCTLPPVGSFPGGAVNARYAVTVASTAPDVCGALTSGVQVANATTVVIGLVRAAFGSPPGIEPRTYAISADPVVDLVSQTATFAFAEVVRYVGASCTPQVVEVPSGSVTVRSNAGGTLRATVSLQLADGGTVAGTVVASTCRELDPARATRACNGSVANLFDRPSCGT